MATTVSEVLGAAGAPLTVTHEGKVYKAQACTLKFKSGVERLLQERDRQPALDLANVVSPETLAALLRSHTDKVRAKAFRWAGPEHLAWLASTEGVLEFAQLVFDLDEETALELCTKRGVEVGMIVKQVVYESLPPALRDAVDKAEREAKEKAERQAKREAGGGLPLPMSSVPVLPTPTTPATNS